MDFQIVLPGNTIAGKGAISRAGLEKYGRKPLIVTGKYTARSAAAAELLKYTPGVVFDGITGEPTVEMSNAGVAAFHENSCDYVIGIGGGSALDSAKAIAAMSALGGNIADYMGRDIDGEFPHMVLIPTTAGTGSEATKFTIITDTEKNIKMLLRGDKLLPDLAVLDYSYTISSPKSVTAATGMDALTHAIESYTSRKANPITDTFALIRGGECWLVGLHIHPYSHGGVWNRDPDRRRRLLLHRKEIDFLDGKLRNRGYALVPLELYFNTDGRVKLLLGLGRGKKLYDKREDMAKRDVQREIDRALKERNR